MSAWRGVGECRGTEVCGHLVPGSVRGLAACRVPRARRNRDRALTRVVLVKGDGRTGHVEGYPDHITRCIRRAISGVSPARKVLAACAVVRKSIRRCADRSRVGIGDRGDSVPIFASRISRRFPVVLAGRFADGRAHKPEARRPDRGDEIASGQRDVCAAVRRVPRRVGIASSHEPERPPDHREHRAQLGPDDLPRRHPYLPRLDDKRAHQAYALFSATEIEIAVQVCTPLPALLVLM